MTRKHSSYQSVLCLLFSLCILQKSTGIIMGHWWNLGLLSWRSIRNNPAYIIAPQPMCYQFRSLSPRQEKLCELHFDHMPSVSVGARLSIRECRRQFQHRRWNCSSHLDAAFGPATLKATREAGFAHSISSAGVVHSISRSCKQARLRTCSCSRAQRPKQLHQDWIWGGCGDNLDHAYRFAKEFVDAREKEKTYERYSEELSRMLMNLHNNEAGRRAVYQLASIQCKCHGVSGSCSLKTCWQSLAPFEKVGEYLVIKYDQSVLVKLNKRGTKLRRAQSKTKRPGKRDLIYINQSPDYCVANPSLSTLGTRGRRCNDASNGRDSCKSLCCGRGFTSFSEVVNEDCRCKFHWCCRIKCDVCMIRRNINICN